VTLARLCPGCGRVLPPGTRGRCPGGTTPQRSGSSRPELDRSDWEKLRRAAGSCDERPAPALRGPRANASSGEAAREGAPTAPLLESRESPQCGPRRLPHAAPQMGEMARRYRNRSVWGGALRLAPHNA
jgi:hypothetical protein